MTQDMKVNSILHTIAKRLVCNGRTRVRQGAHCSSLTGVLKTMLLVLMAVGVNSVWGQSSPKGRDFSGEYFIANHARGSYSSSDYTANYYLCPSTNMYAADQPLLTTNKERTSSNSHPQNAKWTIQFAETKDNVDYYYLIHSSNKYLTWHDPMTIGDNGNATDRVRLHLQSTLNEDKALFFFTEGNIGDNGYNICLKDVKCSRNTVGSLNPAKDNVDGYEGQKKNWTNAGSFTDPIDGTTKVWCGGLIGIYEQNDPTGVWYLEDFIKRPTIAFNSSNLIEITPAQSGTVIIKYTTDGKTPTSEYGETYSVPFDPPANTTMIKAIVIVNGEESNVATFTPTFFLGENHKYLIQSVNCQFYYLIPNQKTTETDYPKNVSTLNVPCNTMTWSFENAVDNDGQYYYIHNSQGGYLYYPTTDNTDNYIFLQQDKDTNDDGYKFSITSHASGGFNIIPKDQTIPVNKTSVGSSDAERLRAVKLAGAIKDASSRWNIILYNNTTGIPQWTDKPFDESTNSLSHFYQITNVNQPTKPLILNNSGFIKSEILPETGYDSRKSMWVIKKVGQDTDGLLDYYTFQNAYTGDLLYYNGRGREITTNASPGVLQTGMPTAEGANATWAHFVIVQTVSGYNIIPRVLVDNTKATSRSSSTHEAFNCIGRANGGDWTGTFYDTDNGTRWTFVELTDVACMDPVFEVSNGNITLSCVTNASKIYINTADNTAPTTESTQYNPSTTSWSESSQLRIKAIAVVSDGTNTSSSNVITLLNKPDVSLTGAPYTYKGTVWEPAVTVSVGEDATETTAASGTYTATYSNNINVGTGTVAITDADIGDSWYIWNVAEQTFAITPKTLTITANNKSIGYGDEPDNDGVAYSGFVNSETEAVLGGTLSYSYNTASDGTGTAYTSFDSPIGTYYIIPSGLTSTNYAITFTAGELTVGQKSIGEGTIATDLILSFDADNSIILTQGARTLVENTDFTVATGSATSKYSIRTVNGNGNYTGYFNIRNAIVHFTSDGSAGATEWSATFVAESAGVGDIGHTLPNGITAYLITSIEGNRVMLEPLDYIPKGVPVLLLANEEKNGFIVQDANSDDVTEVTQIQKDNNMLEEVTAETPGYVSDSESANYQKAYFDTRTIYLLYNNEFVFNKGGYLAKGKVYLDPNHIAPTHSRLRIAWGHSTGIEDSQLSPLTLHHSEWYTLDGRRLNGKPTKKGLYIMYGKKNILK